MHNYSISSKLLSSVLFIYIYIFRCYLQKVTIYSLITIPQRIDIDILAFDERLRSLSRVLVVFPTYKLMLCCNNRIFTNTGFWCVFPWTYLNYTTCYQISQHNFYNLFIFVDFHNHVVIITEEQEVLVRKCCNV